MTILSAQSIMRLRPIIDPQPRTEVDACGVLTTYGLGPAGYDLRLDQCEARPVAGGWVIRPGEFVLASAMEQFSVPPSILGVVHDKSSWARRGLAVQNTVIEPGWHGYLTLELTNHSKHALTLPRGCGICQVIFHLLDEPTGQPYVGKYQGQSSGPQEAR
jgi:dCTP deaminase